MRSSKRRGDDGEDQTLDFLQNRCLQLLARNYRTSGRVVVEIDLIVRDPQGTVVFVDVRSRSRSDMRHGGTLASIGALKRQRIVYAAKVYLSRWSTWPVCRFDVVVLESGQLHWIKGAFEA